MDESVYKDFIIYEHYDVQNLILIINSKIMLSESKKARSQFG